jgi:hypothetical protein
VFGNEVGGGLGGQVEDETAVHLLVEVELEESKRSYRFAKLILIGVSIRSPPDAYLITH